MLLIALCTSSEEIPMNLEKSATEVLRETSRTFYVSIVRLPPLIREAVMSSYLSLRAIDEIEDHPELDRTTKVKLLETVCAEIERRTHQPPRSFDEIFNGYQHVLPEVTNRIEEWLILSPDAIAPTIHRATSTMAQRMAYWVNNDWMVRTKRDLDRYTFIVAGAVGVLLADLWKWYDGTSSRKGDAIGYGRGLQAVNILRNRSEDLARGVDFFPHGWNATDFLCYARSNLLRGDAFVGGFPPGPAYEFCRGPQALAYATLDTLERGETKLSRSAVLEILTPGDSNDNQKPDGQERVVLVNKRDEAIGVEEKIKAHLDGALHRAFSVFVFNSAGDLLLQRRTTTKYHSRGLWSNTCCGHPRPGETIEQASRRRLSEEMGFDSKLRRLFDFVYRAQLEDDLIEHEFDHVLVGSFDGIPNPNSDEVAEWKWMNLAALKIDLRKHPEHYTFWFRVSLDKFHRDFQLALSSLVTPMEGVCSNA
jgi:farnesyl-diphosphate farnesyltransferase